MTIEEFVNRVDDAIAALERIAAAFEKGTVSVMIHDWKPKPDEAE